MPKSVYRRPEGVVIKHGIHPVSMSHHAVSGVNYPLGKNMVVGHTVHAGACMLDALRSMTFYGTMAGTSLPYANGDVSGDWRRVGRELQRAITTVKAEDERKRA